MLVSEQLPETNASVWTLDVDLPPYGVPVDSQLPRHSPDGQPSQLGLLHCFPPFPLEKSGLSQRH